MKSMKIVIVNQHISYTIGGSEIQCDIIATELVNRGHQVIYISPTATKNYISNNSNYLLKQTDGTYNSITKEIIDIRPDVVYWRYNKNNFRIISKKLHEENIPLVFAVAHINDLIPWAVKPKKNESLFSIKHIKKRISKRIEHIGFKYVKAITVNNRDFLKKSPSTNSYYIPNAIPVLNSKKFTWNRPYVAWVSNIKPAKRPELFIDVVKALADFGIDGLMVGAIQSKGYEWITDESKTPDNFYYLGEFSPSQVNGLFESSLLHIHTCYPEGFGNVYIQAWLQSRPTISLGDDPCGYIKQQGIGFNAENNYELFREKVVEWSNNSSIRITAGEKAKEFAIKKFSKNEIINKVEMVLYKYARNEIEM